MLMMFLMQNDVDIRDPYMKTVEDAFIKYSDTVFRLAYSRCNANYADAQDVTMDVFLRLAKRKPELESDEHTKAWLLHTTVNCSKSMQTNAWHRHTMPMPKSAYISLEEELDYVYEAVIMLPLNIRTAIHLFYYEDYSIAEISEAMESNPNTVKSWLKRGRDSLREILEEDDL